VCLQEQQALQELGPNTNNNNHHTTCHLLCSSIQLFLFPVCLQEQQSLQELGLDAETQRNAAGNSYSMMRARIQQLPAATFTQEVGGTPEYFLQRLLSPGYQLSLFACAAAAARSHLHPGGRWYCDTVVM
jgi:hypothetical protein